MSRNAITALRADSTRGDSVLTTMPSWTCVWHAIWSFGAFSTSTRQMRQLPAIDRPGCQQKCGIS